MNEVVYVSDRIYKLFEFLSNKKEKKNVVEIAKYTNTSNRSVYNDLEELENLLKCSEIKLKCQKGHYYLESKNLKEIHRFKDRLISETNEKYYRQKIVIMILLYKEVVTSHYLQNIFSVSRSQIENDISIVQRDLTKFNIDLEKKPYLGMKVVGSEIDKRFILESILFELEKDVRFDTYFSYYMKHEHQSYVKLKKKVTQELIKLDLSDLKRSANLLLLQVSRIKSENELYDNYKIFDVSEDSYNNQLVISMTLIIENSFSISLSEFEMHYLITNLKTEDISIKNNDKFENLAFEISDYAIRYLIRNYTKLMIDLKYLQNGLVLHFKSSLENIVLGKNRINPLLFEFKRQYIFAFNVSAELALSIEEAFDIKMSEDEISFIAMHIQSAMNVESEKIKRQEKIYLYTTLPESYVRLLISQIEKFDPNFKIVDFGTKIPENTKEDIFILSTEHNSKSMHNTLRISPILSEFELKRIFDFINKSNLFKPFELKEYISEETIMLNANCISKEDVIETIGNRLFKLGFVSSDFVETVYHREHVSSTYVTNNIALPHGYSNEVYKNTVVLMTLNNSINWDGDKVNIVILSALKADKYSDFEKLYEVIYDFLNDKETQNLILKATDSSKLYDYF